MRLVGIIDPAAEFSRSVAGLLQSELHAEIRHIPSLPEADEFLAQSSPVALIVGPGIKPDDALLLGHRLLDMDSPTSVVLVTASVDAALLRSALRSGLHDVVAADDPASELVRALREAIETSEKRRQAQPEPADVEQAQRGRVVTVFSMKGGVGKSVVATNLGVSLAQSARTVLVDLDLQFGDCGIMLGLQPTQTIAEAAAAFDRLDREMLEGLLVTHPSGLKVLLAPIQPEHAENITAARITRIITLLQEMFDYVVVDTAGTFDDTVLTALDRSDLVLAVTMMDIASIKNTRISLQKLRQLGYSPKLVQIVLNRADSKVWLQPHEVEQAVGSVIRHRIPSDRLVPRSVNKGVPVVTDAPRSDVTKVFLDLAKSTAATLGEAGHVA